MADATFQITLTFTKPTQIEADALRDNALIDFCKSQGLDIYFPNTQNIDPTKVVPSFRQYIRKYVKNVVIGYRVSLIDAATLITEDTNLGNV